MCALRLPNSLHVRATCKMTYTIVSTEYGPDPQKVWRLYAYLTSDTGAICRILVHSGNDTEAVSLIRELQAGAACYLAGNSGLVLTFQKRGDPALGPLFSFAKSSPSLDFGMPLHDNRRERGAPRLLI
jgi:hypothetical protein